MEISFFEDEVSTYMNGIMSWKLREKQDSDKSLLNFTKAWLRPPARDGVGA
jgi:hypothetical protein